jgi:hypothetical protein
MTGGRGSRLSVSNVGINCTSRLEGIQDFDLGSLARLVGVAVTPGEAL